MRSTTFTALIAFVLSSPVDAFWRLPCTLPLVSQRLDPIVSPGKTPSQHVHTVHGGQNFAANSSYDSLRASKCTSCLVKQDLSNYWFPKLYFKDPSDGHYEAVPNGGLLAYYLQRGDSDVSNGGSGLKAFPPGFKMVSGNPTLRSKKYADGQGSQAELAERAAQFTCLRYTTSNPSYDGHGFPTTDCEAGFQSRLHFPSCWDGKNLDSADHKSHVAYLSGLDNGKCPSGFPVAHIHLFWEITWDVHSFAGRWSGAWPFVYAMGDPTGYGFHGDFQNAWDTNVLQSAIDNCRDDSGTIEKCPYFAIQTADQGNACRTTPTTSEQVQGSLKYLPGCNPIQKGPGDATLYSDSSCPGH